MCYRALPCLKESVFAAALAKLAGPSQKTLQSPLPVSTLGHVGVTEEFISVSDFYMEYDNPHSVPEACSASIFTNGTNLLSIFNQS